MPKLIKYYILHCLATPEGRFHCGDDVRKMHLSPVAKGGRGWKQVGYSDLIRLDGTVENLVPYDDDNEVDAWELTNGVLGINDVARHIVYVGGCAKDKALTPKDTRTPAQLVAMEAQVRRMIAKHPAVKVGGHNQFAAKACPSFDVPRWLRSIGIPEANIYS